MHFEDVLLLSAADRGKTFSLGPDEARSNLLKACLSTKISPVTEKTHLFHKLCFQWLHCLCYIFFAIVSTLVSLKLVI